ncbi:MAG TPA: hypothetical protein VN376_05060, partial [Longilinea sp.]|nr:hypothetical protein [Longilinea sp.]
MTRKQIFLAAITVVLVVVLVGCGQSTTTTSSTGTSSAASSDTTAAGDTNAMYADLELDEVTTLAIGTIGLNGTENAVTAEQADTLITLWQAYQTMAYDDTTAQTELDALVSAISSAMTNAQLDAIHSMDLSSENIQTILSSVSFGGGMGQPNAEGTPAVSAIDPSQMTDTSGMPSGGGPGGTGGGGGVPSGAGGGPGGAAPSGGMPGSDAAAMGGGDMSSVTGDMTGSSTLDPSAQATQQAMMQAQTLNTRIFNMVVQYLQQLAG